MFLCDESNNSFLLSWNSTRIKSVVRSPLAAETLSLVDGCETALYLSDLVRSVSVLGEDSCPGIISITDNKSLFDAVHSYRRLRLDISAVREMCVREVVCVKWIETRGQLSDVLMKKGAAIVATLQSGKNPITLNLRVLSRVYEV